MSSPQHSLPQSSQKLVVTAQAAFLPAGILTTVLRPMLPILIARWALSDTQAIARRARMVPACAQGLGSGAKNARWRWWASGARDF